jgi:AGZA family xanthine/uracil permease-like MFS transporter
MPTLMSPGRGAGKSREIPPPDASAFDPARAARQRWRRRGRGGADSGVGGRLNLLERLFALEAHGTTVRTELLAGFTTFLTMIYIVVVNPTIMGDAGMPVAAVAIATCLAAGLGSVAMGLFSNTPLALAPGMGLNAYFTYTVVKGMGVPWETALGCVFLSGAAFLVLTLIGVRQLIVGAIPRALFSAVAGGIGLFIAFIGLKDAGIIVANPATTVGLGDLTTPTAAVSLLGLLVIGVLLARKVKAAMLIGIVVAAVAGGFAGLVHVSAGAYDLGAISATAFKLDIPAAFGLKGGLALTLVEIVFVFLFVDLFDNVGTLVAVTTRAGLVAPDGTIPRLNRILLTDSVATMAGAMLGTSTVTSYIESAAGVSAGGRTGLTSVVVGALFLVTLFFAPLVQAIPTAATAPALILVGALMVGAVAEIEWGDPVIAIPAFLTLVTIPLTYSIANGLAFGITSYAVMILVAGRARPKDWLLFVLAALFVARFVYLAKG